MIPFIDLVAQKNRITSMIDDGIRTVLNHGKFILGPEVFELETALCNYTGSKYCISVANGTDAIQISLMALGVGPGDEVIVPAFSYISCAETVALLGAKIVYADINPHTFNINPSLVERAITPKTKAIIAVSLYGLPADFDALNAIAESFGVVLIEDAAQSFGGKLNDKISCNLAKISCTSFFPTKPLGCYGDGGAIFTSDEYLAQEMRKIARHGQEKRYYHTRLGINSRLDTIQAAILLAKLTILEEEIQERAKIAKRYSISLIQLNDDILIPDIPEGYSSAWAQYTIRIKNREKFQKSLSLIGIPWMIYYPISLNNQPAVACELSFPHSEAAALEVLSLPVYGTLEPSIQEKIIECLLNEGKVK